MYWFSFLCLKIETVCGRNAQIKARVVCPKEFFLFPIRRSEAKIVFQHSRNSSFVENILICEETFLFTHNVRRFSNGLLKLDLRKGKHWSITCKFIDVFSTFFYNSVTSWLLKKTDWISRKKDHIRFHFFL